MLIAVSWTATSVPSQTIRYIDSNGLPQRAQGPASVPERSWPGARATEVVDRVLSGERLVTGSGMQVLIEGVQAADRGSSATAVSRGAETARRALADLVMGRVIELTFEDRRPEGDALRAHVHLSDGRLLASVLAEGGHVRPSLEVGGLEHADAILRSATVARDANRGVWQRSAAQGPPTKASAGRVRGFGLGMYGPTQDHDYDPLLSELESIGATDVMLVVPHFVHDWRSTSIAPRPGRTPSWETIDRTIRQARKRGLRTGIMPIILLATGGDSHWRGDLKPRSLQAWFRSYGRHLGRCADVGRDAGADWLVVGSELCSLERHTPYWKTLIASLRARFPGKLTYSANWDQLDEVRFWDELDLIGMTGYHKLASGSSTSVDLLVMAWTPIKEALLRLQRLHGKPFAFTEIGYASVDGIAAEPWNYRLRNRPDALEQAHCYEAFVRTWQPAPPGFAGAWFYDWWRNGDATDKRGYTVHGKPAEKIVRRYFSR